MGNTGDTCVLRVLEPHDPCNGLAAAGHPPIFQLRETRNQRRTRRRAETRDERAAQRRANVLSAAVDAPILVFQCWERCGSMRGYAYNHPRFANGAGVVTGSVLRNLHEFADTHDVWMVHTQSTIWRVRRIGPAWRRVGAGHRLNRLKYKLWPKFVILALYLRIARTLAPPRDSVCRQSP